MYVTREMVDGMIAKYGRPEIAHFAYPLNEREYNLILRSLEKNRLHDFTLYVTHDDEYIVIAKHTYPPNLYRAPSGGLNPDEPFEIGIARESQEEIGCVIALDKFLIESKVRFTYKEASIDWTSYVFTAHYVSGDFQFTDHHEIREVHMAKLSEFEEYGRIMRSTDVGGFHYRAALHDEVLPLLTK
jgi:ADP-ribose pyrophosphatase YjhB (NUDIX family)